MKYQQNAWKMASGKPKYTKHNNEKWSAGGVSTFQKPHYKPPFVQHQSCFRTENKKQRHFFHKSTWIESSPLCAPHAPRNTTSYIIRAKNCGGIAPTPSPSTPTLSLGTPPYDSEGSVEQINPEWGVDSYGSMKGLLKVRHTSPQTDDTETNCDKFVQLENLNEKLEQRLDQDIGRFEMIYPHSNESIAPETLETRINDQDNHIAYLEEESTILKERVHSMEQELDILKHRMRVLEGANAFKHGEICSGEASFA